jgi:hypothetical protein
VVSAKTVKCTLADGIHRDETFICVNGKMIKIIERELMGDCPNLLALLEEFVNHYEELRIDINLFFEFRELYFLKYKKVIEENDDLTQRIAKITEGSEIHEKYDKYLQDLKRLNNAIDHRDKVIFRLNRTIDMLKEKQLRTPEELLGLIEQSDSPYHDGSVILVKWDISWLIGEIDGSHIRTNSGGLIDIDRIDGWFDLSGFTIIDV